jgi:uncharacterized membrane protein
LIFPALGLLLMIIGWPLATRRVPPNRWYGLRVRATFADEHVWYEANAATGHSLMLLGAGLMAICLGLPHLVRLEHTMYTALCGILLAIGSMILTMRSWRLANRLLRERRK